MYKKIVIVGTGKFAFQCAKIAKNYCDDLIITEHKINNNITILKRLAEKEGIKYQELEEGMLEEITKNIFPEKLLIVSATNTYIFRKSLVELSNVKIINYHPALLPNHPGRNAEAWAIYEMDKKTGVTWHIVSAEIDKGDIIGQEEMDVCTEITSLQLMMEQNVEGIKLFDKIFPDIISGSEKRTRQSTLGRIHYSYEIPNDGYMDIDWSNEKKSAFLRAMDYGKLQILGIPKLKIKDKVYTWKSYEVVEIKENVTINESDLLIEGSSLNIILRNLRRYFDE